MIDWIETKYTNLIGSRLVLFKKKQNVWNFRCPICGDSQKNKFKARGFIYEKAGRLLYICHNCNVSMSFGSFLKTIDAELHKQFVLEKYKEKTTHVSTKRPAEPDISQFHTPKFIKYTELNQLKKISQLEPEHPAKRYVVYRKIPNYFHSKLFYAPKFKKFTNTLVPGKFAATDVDEPRLIIPLVDQYENLFGFQGRSFSPTGIRYITIILNDQMPKVYGLEHVKIDKKVYVFEGPIDSMFVPNSMAMVGSSLDLSTLPIAKSNIVIVFDNEPRNKEIVKSVEKYISLGYNVCIWPTHIEQKDVNEMVLAGVKPVDIKLIIDNNTFCGLSAMVQLNQWKKI